MPNRLIFRILTVLTGVLLLSSCSEYQRALKNPDPNYKFEFAKRAFEQKKYVQSYTLLRDVVTQLKGSDRAEESLYLLGLSYFENKEYPEAAELTESSQTTGRRPPARATVTFPFSVRSAFPFRILAFPTKVAT